MSRAISIFQRDDKRWRGRVGERFFAESVFDWRNVLFAKSAICFVAFPFVKEE